MPCKHHYDVYYPISNLLKFGKFFGMAPYGMKKTRNKAKLEFSGLIISLIIAVMMMLSYVVALTEYIEFIPSKAQQLQVILNGFRIGGVSLTVILMLEKQNFLLDTLHRINSFDQKVASFGIKTSYFKYNLINIFAFILILFSQIYLSYFKKSPLYALFHFFSQGYHYIITGLIVIYINFFCFILGSKLNLLIHLAKNINRCSRKRPLEVLVIISSLYDDVYYATRYINKVISIPVLFLTVTSILEAMVVANLIYHKEDDFVDRFYIGLYSFQLIAALLPPMYVKLKVKLQLAKNQPKKVFETNIEKPRPRPSTVARAVFKSQAVTSTPMVCNRKLTFNDSQSVSPIEASISMKGLQKSNDFFNKSQNNSSLQEVVCKGKPKDVSHITLSSISDDNKERENKSKRLENVVTKLLKNNVDKSNKMVQTSNKSLSAVKKTARSSTTHIIKERQTQTGESLVRMGGKDGRLSSSSLSDSSDASDFLYQCEKNNTLPHNIFKAAALYSKKKLSIDSAAPWRAPSGLCKSNPLVEDLPEILNESSSLDETFVPKTLPKKKVFANKRRLNKKRKSTNKSKIHTPVSTVDPTIKNNSVNDKPFRETRITRTTSKKDMATSTSEKLDTPNIVVQEQNSKSTSVREEPVNLSPEIENVQITSPERVNNRLEREKVVTRSSSKNEDRVAGGSCASHEIGQVQSADISFDLNQNKRKRMVSEMESEVDKKRSPAIPSKTKGKKNLSDNRNDDPPFREISNEPVFNATPATVSNMISLDQQNGEVRANRSSTKSVSFVKHSEKCTKKKEKELRVVIDSIDDYTSNPVSSSSTKKDAEQLKSKRGGRSTAAIISRASSQESLDNGSLRRSTRERRPPPPRSGAGVVTTKSSFFYKFVTRDNSLKNISKDFKSGSILSSGRIGISPIREIDEFEREDNDNSQPGTSTQKDIRKSVSSGRVNKRKKKNNSAITTFNGTREKSTKKNKCSVDICDCMKMRNTKLTFNGPLKNLPLVNDVGMMITSNDPLRGYSTGYMKIAPGGHKPRQVTNVHNMIFTIHEGEAQVGIQNATTRIYPKHSVFNVMKGCEYFIKNMNAKEHLLLSFVRLVAADT